MPQDQGGSVTIVGLGPGEWETLTIEAASVLQAAGDVYVRNSAHPGIESIRKHIPHVELHAFDELYATLPSLEGIDHRIAHEIAQLARRPGGVIYAVLGSPTMSEASVRLVHDLLDNTNVPIRIVSGISVVESVLLAAGLTNSSWFSVLDATEITLLSRENAVGEVGGASTLMPWRSPSPTAPLLIWYLYDRATISAVARWLGRYYPATHAVTVVRAPGTPACTTEIVPLRSLDSVDGIDHRSALFVPALPEDDNVRTFAGLMNVTRTLRAPQGCPWDREQTHATLKPHLLEETYEVLDALDTGDPELLAEEMGDLLFQITIHSQVAAEAGEFTIEDVIQSIVTKLIGRHPHVFGDMRLESSQDVRSAWESFKQREKPKRSSVLEEIPHNLPALPKSNLMQKRAASVGFEWPSLEEVVNKVEEELDELRAETTIDGSKDRQREEFGDILFALVSMGRHLRIDPEEALRLANRKFAARFQYVESRVTALGKTLRDVPPDELDVYWEEAKALGTVRT